MWGKKHLHESNKQIHTQFHSGPHGGMLTCHHTRFRPARKKSSTVARLLDTITLKWGEGNPSDDLHLQVTVLCRDPIPLFVFCLFVCFLGTEIFAHCFKGGPTVPPSCETAWAYPFLYTPVKTILFYFLPHPQMVNQCRGSQQSLGDEWFANALIDWEW